jgi:hypothetical protein
VFKIIDAVSSRLPDLTGNSSIARIGTDLYTVSNVRVDNSVVIYRSIDSGTTWNILHTITIPAGTKRFDPVLVSDGTNLHFLASVASTDIQRYDVIKYGYEISTDTLTPVTLVTGNMYHGGYDLILRNDGLLQIAVSISEPLVMNPSMVDPYYWGISTWVMGTDNSIQNYVEVLGLGTNDLQPNTQTIGGLSLCNNPTNPESVDIFWTHHKRTSLFKDVTVYIDSILTTVSDGSSFTLSDVFPVTQFQARYTEDDLTALSTSDTIIISQSYYTQIDGNLISSSILGRFYNSMWDFKVLHGDKDVSWCNPTPSISIANDIYYSILECTTGIKLTRVGLLRTYYLDQDMSLSLIPTNTVVRLQTLRGSKELADNSSDWYLQGVDSDGISHFMSRLNLPPKIQVTPSSLILKRGVPTTIDASGTLDPDQDPITFKWTSDDTTGKFHITGDGPIVTILADKSIGPDQRTINITLTVNDHPLD